MIKAKLDHVPIVVKNIEKAIKFYSEVFGWHIPEKGPYSKVHKMNAPGTRRRRIKYALLVSDHDYTIELIEPSEGYWMKQLEEKGEGAIGGLCVHVDDIEKFSQKLEKEGITPVDRFNQPLKERYFVAPSGARCFCLPIHKSFGTLIEVCDRPWEKERP